MGHFVWNKNLSRLISWQLSKKKSKKYICDRCLHYFHSNENHIIDCNKLNDCTVVLPTEDNKWLSFTNYSRREWIPFVVYADLEFILEKTLNEEKISYVYQHHKVRSIAYCVRCSYDESLSAY
ncbi:uncharacterized protein LOC112590209 [Harpegnathos saltator]|uniref:uncharacterized protein LOC112590209 n=1 Tax=Harpegnathos saltator TaxID=610380 RepID=UPI000DBEE388|nr:uncharacterized protein LOC112590209 [Harpegnathos saltator]